jgi:hypothetical protein
MMMEDYDGMAAVINPMYGIELNRKTTQPIGIRKEMYLLEPGALAGNVL